MKAKVINQYQILRRLGSGAFGAASAPPGPSSAPRSSAGSSSGATDWLLPLPGVTAGAVGTVTAGGVSTGADRTAALFVTDAPLSPQTSGAAVQVVDADPPAGKPAKL